MWSNLRTPRRWQFIVYAFVIQVMSSVKLVNIHGQAAEAREETVRDSNITCNPLFFGFVKIRHLFCRACQHLWTAPWVISVADLALTRWPRLPLLSQWLKTASDLCCHLWHELRNLLSNTGLWLVNNGHVTSILASDWSLRLNPRLWLDEETWLLLKPR